MSPLFFWPIKSCPRTAQAALMSVVACIMHAGQEEKSSQEREEEEEATHSRVT